MPPNRENDPPVVRLDNPPASLLNRTIAVTGRRSGLGPDWVRRRRDRWTFLRVLNVTTASTCQGWRLRMVASVPNAEGVWRSRSMAWDRFRSTPIGLTPGVR